MGLMGLMGFVFYIIDRKKYASIIGLISNITNIYGVPTVLVSDRHFFLTYISGLLREI